MFIIEFIIIIVMTEMTNCPFYSTTGPNDGLK